MPTIRDVARLAGVSTATVSRILNGRGKYTVETERKVRKAVDALGFSINRRARGLKTGASGAIGFLIGEGTLLAYPEVLNGALKQVQSAGYDMEILLDRSFHDCLRMMSEGRHDGMLFAESLRDNRMLSEFLGTGRPFVLLGGDTERDDVNLVEIDFFQGGYTATLELIGMGHTRILFLSDGGFGVDEILRGYLFALDENGIQYREDLLLTGPLDEPGGYVECGQRRVLPFLREGSCTAVLATDDRLAAGGLRAARAAGLGVPGGFSLIGFGDRECARACDPPLTSVSVPAGELGEIGAEFLLSDLNRKDSSIKRMKLNTRMVRRGSVDSRSRR
jgi:LacI family transcriptional regulator